MEGLEEGKKRISEAVIRRLPRYYRFLSELQGRNVERISSKELSRSMGITASQVRQDLNQFGGFGQQGYGYNVDYLQREIGKILGLNQMYTMIIIGAGNLGRAICNHQNFDRRGFHIAALFDVNPEMTGKEINRVPVYSMDFLETYLREKRVDIAALCIPSSRAQEVAMQLCSCGIKGLWNFSSVELRVPEPVKVENVRLTESLMTLSFAIKEAGGKPYEE